MLEDDSAPDAVPQPASQVAAGDGWQPDQAYVNRLFQIESGGNPNAVTGSNRGLGQFGPHEEKMYGITDENRSDPNAQAAAVMREAQQHGAILQRALGRPPTPGEAYLMHQQGIGGGPALLTADPNTPAWQAIRRMYPNDAIAQKAIYGNIPSNDPLRQTPVDQITAGQFRDMWVKKFEGGGGYPRAGGLPGGSPPVGNAPAPVTLASDQNNQNPLTQMGEQLMQQPKPQPFAPMAMRMARGSTQAPPLPPNVAQRLAMLIGGQHA